VKYNFLYKLGILHVGFEIDIFVLRAVDLKSPAGNECETRYQGPLSKDLGDYYLDLDHCQAKR